MWRPRSRELALGRVIRLGFLPILGRIAWRPCSRWWGRGTGSSGASRACATIERSAARCGSTSAAASRCCTSSSAAGTRSSGMPCGRRCSSCWAGILHYLVDRRPVVADRRAERLPGLSLHRVPQPGLSGQGAAALSRGLLSDAPGEPRAAAGCPAGAATQHLCRPGLVPDCCRGRPATWLTSTTASAAVDMGTPATSPSMIRLPCSRTDRARRPKGTAVPLLTILTPCFNEEGNVRELYEAVKAAMATVPDLEYEHLFIDNASTDGTVRILRELAAADKRAQGHRQYPQLRPVRSPYHAFLEARGDAVLAFVADFQDPPELIPQFIREVARGLQGRHRREGRQQRAVADGAGPARCTTGSSVGSHRTSSSSTTSPGSASTTAQVVELFRSTERAVPVLPGHGGRVRLRAGRDPVLQAGPPARASRRTTS